MKYLTLIFLIGTIVTFSQSDEYSQKNVVYLSVGHPSLWDMPTRENRFGINLGYQRSLGKSFLLEAFVSRKNGNSTVDYFEDNAELIRRIGPVGPDAFLIEYGKIDIYAAGLKVHFAFINKQKHFFGFSGGVGYYTSESLEQDITGLSFDNETNEITFLDTGIFQETVDGPFLTLGLSYFYRWKYGINVGVDFHTFSDISSRMMFNEPILANHFFIGVLVGKRF
jgi:hypothetical protein